MIKELCVCVCVGLDFYLDGGVGGLNFLDEGQKVWSQNVAWVNSGSCSTVEKGWT